MGFDYLSVEDAIAREGLRMVVVGGVPSPWGEAAKGIFHIKRIAWLAVRLAYDSEAMQQWTGQRNGPVAMYANERPRSGWAEILLLAERLAPSPSLIPAEPAERALMFGLAHELLGEEGLAWTRRLQLVHAGLNNAGGFNEKVAGYLARKYGYRADAAAGYGARVAELLRIFAARLKAQRAAGSPYYIGDALTAVDVYGAAVTALFRPLPPEQCEMNRGARAAFETLDQDTLAALDTILIGHRDMMYAKHLELPLAL